ncbi:MAG TPA: hypothetical protein VIJ14_05610 [Rhabdochlamydiaceae bacterium]
MSDQPSIQDLTKLVLFSGRISEVHVRNLKSFPWIFFNFVKECHLDYGFAKAKEEESFVHYRLNIEGDNDGLPKRYQALESAVRSLFWKEVKVKVSINDQEVFKSE